MRKIIALLAVLVIVAIPLVAAQEYVQTTLHFNIPSQVAFTLTLPGEGAVESAVSPSSTTDVEFNATTGTEANVEACVVGGTCQNSTVPIFSYDNIGTVNVNLTVYVTSALPACITLEGGTSYPPATSIGTTNVTVVNDFTPAAAAQDWFMRADFSGCTSADATTRTLMSRGIES